MQWKGVQPDHIRFVRVLNACANLVVALEEGILAHEQSIQTHYEYDVFVGNNLVDMYAKCGSMADAWRLFSKMHSHNEVSWNAMLGGYAMDGHGAEAFAHF